MTTHTQPSAAGNIVTLDQENHVIVAVVNAGPITIFDPVANLDLLPAGGGLVVADGNTWSVRNQLSKSQYCFETEADLDAFLAALTSRGYQAITIANKLANSLCKRYDVTQPNAVRALYTYVHDQVSAANGRPTAERGTGEPVLVCGCAQHWSFDSGHPVRSVRGDASFGARSEVTAAFLRLQNTDGYHSGFADDVVAIAWAGLDRETRKLFKLAVTKPVCKPADRNRLMAIAACTHDPATGLLRTHDGQPWGTTFITRRVIGLSGAMRGTGERGPGNPMRAVLRVLGRRTGTKVNAAERAALDRGVRDLIRALKQHPQLRPV